MKIAFVTDSGTGKTIEQEKKDGIYSLPLQVGEGEKTYRDLEDITLDTIFKKIREEKLLTTSLPIIGEVTGLFQSLKDDGYEMIFAVPICRGLSGTIDVLESTAKQIDIPFMYVDCHVTALLQDYLVHEAKRLYEEGTPIEEVKRICEGVVESASTLLLPEDLQHLRRGGRLTALAATLAGILKINPILKIDATTNGKIDVAGKVRTRTRAIDTMLQMMKEHNVDDSYSVTIAHADVPSEAQSLADKIKDLFHLTSVNIVPLMSVVSVHTGIGCLCIQYYKKLTV